MIETKVKAGTAAGGAVGAVAWALVTFVPAFKNGIPQPLMDALPFILAWAGHTIAAYLAPHTRRPDLPQPGLTVTGGPVTTGNRDVTGEVRVIHTPSLGPVTGTLGGALSAGPPATGTSGPASATGT